MPAVGGAQAPSKAGLKGSSAATPAPAAAPKPAGAPGAAKAAQGMTSGLSPSPSGGGAAAPKKQKSIADLRKVGLERPPQYRKQGPPRKSALRAPHRRKLAIKLEPRELEQAQARNKRYEEREAKAPTQVAEKLKKLRTALAKKKASFQVGATSVSDKPLKEITGLTGEPDPKAAREQRKKREARRIKPNLVKATMRERATPPPSAPKRGRDRRDADDTAPLADSKIIVTPDDARGSSGEWFPSSAMPSPTNPQFSWRDKLSPVRNQNVCGSCWAFSVLGAYEGSQSLLNAERLDLSEQQLVNCVPAHPSTAGDNCRGNMPATALEWMSSVGPPSEQSLPYAGRMASCNASLGKSEYRAFSWGFVSEDDPRRIPSNAEIKEALVTHGPLASTVFVTEAFQSYTGGVFDENAAGRPNHAIVITGWDDARQAWHVRNSWGTAWGEDGYIWVRYGVNSIGYLTNWVDAEKVKKPPPEDKLFKDRYVSLRNDAGEDLDVFVQAQVPAGSGFKWLPAEPQKSEQAFKFRVPKGKTFDPKRPDNGKFLRAKALRVWATSTDGKRVWSELKGKTLNVASKSYKAAARDRFTHTFTKTGRTPSADDVLLEAHELKEDRKLGEARERFELFAELFPEDDRAHEARFWVGWTENQQGEHWDAAESLFEMITAAPEDESNVPFAFYYLGDSYSQLGYCGYAVRSFEVVALGEVDAPREWIKAAKDMIKFLNDDEGQVCDNWD